MDYAVVGTIARKELGDILSEKVYWLAFVLELFIVLGVILLGIAFAAMMNPVEMATNSPDLRLRIGVLDESGGGSAILRNMVEEGIIVETATRPELLRDDVASGRVMGGVVLPSGYDETRLDLLDVNLLVDPDKIYSGIAIAKIEKVIEKTNEELSAQRLRASGMQNFTHVNLVREDLGKPAVPITSADFVEAMYLMVIPLVFLFPVLLAANMTADSIVGEKERGTLGILLSTPASPFDIAVGKVLPILLLVNAQFVLWIVLLENNAMGSVRVFNKLPLLIILNLAAVCFVCVALLISSKSKSSKESNLYLTLLVLATILPLFVVVPEMGPMGSWLESLMLVRLVGVLAASPGIPVSGIALGVSALGFAGVALGALCVRSIGDLEPPPST